ARARRLHPRRSARHHDPHHHRGWPVGGRQALTAPSNRVDSAIVFDRLGVGRAKSPWSDALSAAMIGNDQRPLLASGRSRSARGGFMILDPGFNLTLRPMNYPAFYEMYLNAIKNTWT